MRLNSLKYSCFIGLFVVVSSVQAETVLPDFVSLIEKHASTVVKIETETKSRFSSSPYGRSTPYDQVPEPFRHFFGDPRYQQSPRQQQPRQTMGSGFIVSKDGYILTNNHVIDGADKIMVNLNDGNEYEAALIGTDPRSDLALLKINAELEGLPTITFSKQPAKVGEWVLAIGSPFGLDYSVSQGIVSALGRSLPAQDNSNYVPFIQTDVAINPGNSGGPLFNLQGEVVGINSQIFTRSGGYMGLSFAIPASLAKSVVQQLTDNGYVSRGWLGVSIQNVDMDLARSFGLKKPRGALVAQLVPNSPSQGVLENGDIILTFAEARIKKSGDLPHVVGMTPANTKVDIEILRQGQKQIVTMTLGELPGESNEGSIDHINKKLFDNRLGLQVEPLDNEMQKTLSIAGGVVVREVLPDNPADVTGLRVGDVITQLGFANINDVAGFKKHSEALPKGSPQPIRFFRQGQPVFRTIVIN